MNAVRIETTVQTDGELHLTRLPCRQGDRVEAIVLILEKSSVPPADHDAAAKARQKALEEFLDLARSSKFRSEGPYPKRDELYDRSL